VNVPWTKVLAEVDTDEASVAIERARLDWETSLHSMTIEVTDDEGTIVPTTVDDHSCVVRLDNQLQLGVVGSSYKDIQNDRAFEIFESIAREGDLKFTHAGELAGGRIIMAVVDLGRTIELGDDDIIFGHICMFTSHNGSRALGAMLMATTSEGNAALNVKVLGKRSGIKIRHTGDVKQKVKQASKIIDTLIAAFESYEEKVVRPLIGCELSFRETKEVLLELVPDPKREGASNSKAAKRRDKIRELFEIGPGAHLPSRESTAWGLLCAVSQYYAAECHTRGVEDDDEVGKQTNRMKAVWFGSGGQSTLKTASILLDLIKRKREAQA